MITQAEHIPSHISVAGHRALVTYEVQPMTYYGCNDTGHLYKACPMRRRLQEMALISAPTAWADITSSGTGNTLQACEEKKG
jgi:hypothetical protein